MKKAIKILFKSILIFIGVVFLLLLIIPVFFKDTIKEKVVEQANKSIEATLSFDDFSLSLIRNFPNLSFRLENVEVTGVGKFEGETLAGFRSFGFVFDLSSLIGKNGYNLKSLVLDRPVANAIVLADGTTNWDIMKKVEEKAIENTETETEAKEGELKVNLERIEIKKAAVSYTDYSSGMAAGFGSLDLRISGNFSESMTKLLISLLIEDIDIYMQGERYVNSAVIKGDLDIGADLEDQVFTLNNNSFGLNDLILFIDGSVALDNDIIRTDINLASGETDFKSLLSLVPAFFMSDFDDLETKGAIKLDVDLAGNYNSSTGELPDVGVILTVSDGTVWLKGEPELMSDLNINTSVKVNEGRITGDTDVRVSMIDLGRVMEMLPPADTTVVQDVDTSSKELDLVTVPDNIDFEFRSIIDHFLFNSLDATEVKSHILVRDRKLTVDETGLKTLGGQVELSALYNTEDVLNPFMNASVVASDIGIKDAYDSFVTVQKLAPVAEGMDGRASVLFEFESELKQDMMPDLNSINGFGGFHSEEIQLLNSSLFNKFSGVLNIDDKLSNTFKDVDVEFRIENGRVYFNDFETELGNIGLTIGGDHGIDQTINYMISSEIPTSEMPASLNTLVSGLATQAKLFGMEYIPPEVFNVNVGIEGTVKDPKFKPSIGKPGEGAGSSVKASVKAVVEEKVEEVKETVNEEISKQRDKIMEEAEKQSDQVKAEAAKAAQLLRDEAIAGAQKLIEEAESKGPLAKIAARKAADVMVAEGNKKADKLEAEASVKADKILEEARKKIEKS